MKPRGWLLFSFLLIIQVAYAKIPREYEEVENQDNMLFTVTEPYTLAYTYQMKHAFMLGVHFPDGANKTFRNLEMVLADPVHGCEALRNEIFAPSVILMERGECSFTVKALNGEKAGATVIMVTDSQNYEYSYHQYYVNMIPDESLDRANVPCVYVAPVTGRYFRDHLEEGGTIKLDIPVERNYAPWVHHQKKAPWEIWPDEDHYF
ncbi:PA domain-containing protein [Caenorhabditis elegans]|uniref:PA domain-containing protein n=1 Tax=Caenorhabditis elegans TaxID=6239 RepID=Q22322_CAEEL|nr:PA domain-containing protein [Caenorhabditis elegans]CCD70853.2 PA domain-containing protein [Caenorhabditis elegans]